jgi:multidrug resistance efflux pump
VATMGIVGVGRVSQYATGPVLVEQTSRVVVVAEHRGIVTEVLARPDAVVEAGQTLARLDCSVELAAWQRADQEYEQRLLTWLRDPGAVTNEALLSLAAERQLAHEHLLARSLVTELAGRVADLPLRVGQALEVGDRVASIVGREATFAAVLVLPGHARPRLRPGQTVRVEIEGYPRQFLNATLEDVEAEVVSADAVRQRLPQDWAGLLELSGPVVVARARLDGSTFGRQAHGLYHGMRGRADIRVGRVRLLELLIPALGSGTDVR